MGNTKVGNREITLNEIKRKIRRRCRSFCKSNCGLKLRVNSSFEGYVKSDDSLKRRLKRLMKKEKLTKKQALARLKSEIRENAIECLCNTIINIINAGDYTIIYSNLPCHKRWYFARLLDQLIRRGFIKAYLDLKLEAEVEELRRSTECQGVKELPNDPWLSDNKKSAEIKIWSFHTTGDKALREKRINCWAKHIKLDLTNLIKALSIEDLIVHAKLMNNVKVTKKNNVNNAKATPIPGNYNDNTYQDTKSDSAVEEGFKWHILAPDASVVDSIEKNSGGIMNIPSITKPIIYSALDSTTKPSSKPKGGRKSDKKVNK